MKGASNAANFEPHVPSAIIIFPSKQEADSKLGDIQGKLNKGAYVINLDRWCLHPTDRTGFTSVKLRSSFVEPCAQLGK